MALHIEKIEAFFETQFQDKAERVWQLTKFDGYAYWIILYFPADQFLKFIMDRDPILSATPAVEIEGSYSEEVSVSPLIPEGHMLMLRPQGAINSRNYVCITKVKNGRFSLSTTVGQPAV